MKGLHNLFFLLLIIRVLMRVLRVILLSFLPSAPNVIAMDRKRRGKFLVIVTAMMTGMAVMIAWMVMVVMRRWSW